MRNIAITVLVTLVILTLIIEGVSFQVRESESVLVTTFGKPTRTIVEPGLYFKFPPPINSVYRFDNRLRVYESGLAQTSTKESTPIIIDTYILWRIADPLKFNNSVGTVTEAENKLQSQLNNTQNSVIAGHYFSDFVNPDPKKIQIGQIQKEMLAGISKEALEIYGIRVEDVGLKQLKVSGDVTKNVFEFMRSERSRKTYVTLQEGDSESMRIRSDANSKQTELLAAADRKASKIMGEGDAEAAKYYKMLEEEPELAIFLRSIESLQTILGQRSTYFISTESWPFNILRQMPEVRSDMLKPDTKPTK